MALILFMEMTYHSGCDAMFIWLTAIGFWLQCLANKYYPLVCAENFQVFLVNV